MDAPAPTLTPEDAEVPEGLIHIERQSTAQEIAPKLNRTAADVIRFLMEQGEMVTATQTLSDDMIELFAAEIGADVSLIDEGEEQEVELLALLEIDEEEIAEIEAEKAEEKRLKELSKPENMRNAVAEFVLKYPK